MDHFLICGDNQLHDLHSRLILNHPRGSANQLHKCIVTHPKARGVFDGNVKVCKIDANSQKAIILFVLDQACES